MKQMIRLWNALAEWLWTQDCGCTAKWGKGATLPPKNVAPSGNRSRHTIIYCKLNFTFWKSNKDDLICLKIETKHAAIWFWEFSCTCDRLNTLQWHQNLYFSESDFDLSTDLDLCEKFTTGRVMQLYYYNSKHVSKTACAENCMCRNSLWEHPQCSQKYQVCWMFDYVACMAKTSTRPVEQ